MDNPFLTVDIIIELGNRGIVLIKRKNPPHGWALPGGFVDYGERIEMASVRAQGLDSFGVKTVVIGDKNHKKKRRA